MSGLAVFGFKFPSLLQFEKRRNSEPMISRNLRTLYGVKNVPSDTGMRERLDQIDVGNCGVLLNRYFLTFNEAKHWNNTAISMGTISCLLMAPDSSALKK